MKVLFVTGFGPIVRDLGESARFYRDAESCFGTREWPKDVPAPQGGIEFDVEDIGLSITPWMREGGGH